MRRKGKSNIQSLQSREMGIEVLGLGGSERSWIWSLRIMRIWNDFFVMDGERQMGEALEPNRG